MRLSMTCLLLVGVLVAGSTEAQTTGFPGFNDYTITGLGSGSTSCTALTFATPVTLNFQISTAGPGRVVYLMASDLPCFPGTFTGFTCQGTTFDLIWTPSFFFTPLPLTGPFGFTGTSLAVPPLLAPFRFSTQCAIIDPGCAGLVLFTQAYEVILI
ncbi:MAG: hypothetical protein KDB53_08965 [Planctomycetes bacterium]|nr:hypothetical protein [Planctomycetota bacterium]